MQLTNVCYTFIYSKPKMIYHILDEKIITLRDVYSVNTVTFNLA